MMKTNAVRLLEAADFKFNLYEYDTAGASAYMLSWRRRTLRESQTLCSAISYKLVTS